MMQYLVEDLEQEALYEWQCRPEPQRTFLQKMVQPRPASPQPRGPDGAETEEGQGQQDSQGQGAPVAVDGPPLPALSCPLACGCGPMPPGYDFAAHLVLFHMPELQVWLRVTCMGLKAYANRDHGLGPVGAAADCVWLCLVARWASCLPRVKDHSYSWYVRLAHFADACCRAGPALVQGLR